MFTSSEQFRKKLDNLNTEANEFWQEHAMGGAGIAQSV
jgi:hypothetical protein